MCVCVFFTFRGSMCHLHALVIYKDVKNPVSKNEENPVSKNEALQKELHDFKAELTKLWQHSSSATKKLKLM